MISTQLLKDILEDAGNRGADFAEIFIEENRTRKLTRLDNTLKETTAGIDYGVGIRLVQDGKVYYSHTSDDSEKGLRSCLDKASFFLEKNAGKSHLPVHNTMAIDVDLSVKNDFDNVPLRQKADFLLRADLAARATSTAISQVSVSYLEQNQSVRIINSQGLDVSDRRNRGRLQITAIAARGSQNQAGYEAPGAIAGYEFFENLDVEALARTAARRAVLMLDAEYCPSGTMPVIIDQGFGGVIFHEACGHGLESASVMRNNSVYAGKLGEKIAADCVSAADHGLIDHSWGSLAIDDEGSPAQNTLLIENGILKTYMCDRLGAQALGISPTGSARRESYRFAPVSRMRNTFILPGNSSLDAMICATDYGLYAKSLGGGSVNTATGEFNFAVTEGYIVRNGRIEKPVRGATLIGKGHEVLHLIDHVGSELGLAQGMCGAASGWVPVNVGQPALRVSKLLVGGR